MVFQCFTTLYGVIYNYIRYICCVCYVFLVGLLYALVFLSRFQDGWKTLDRFEREASVLQRLRHPCIPRFYGSLVRDGPGGRDLGLVSDLVRGASLEELVAQGRWRATPEKLRQLAESLLEVCVHLASFAPPVVHRDIKPANVLLETDSEELKAGPKQAISCNFRRCPSCSS